MIILPYLHERKIYLNKMKPTNKYFYTTIKKRDDEMLMTLDENTKDFFDNLDHDYVEDGH